MKKGKCLLLAIMLMTIAGIGCSKPAMEKEDKTKYAKGSMALTSTDEEFEGIPKEVIEAIKNDLFSDLSNEGGSFREDYPTLNRDNIVLVRPYEVYLIKADALDKDTPCGFDGLFINTYDLTISDTMGKTYLSKGARITEEGKIFANGYSTGGNYDDFLKKKKCPDNGRRIIVRKINKSGHSRVYQFVGCLHDNTKLESGRYWKMEELGNQIDESDSTTYSWEQVFNITKYDYYREIVETKGRDAWK